MSDKHVERVFKETLTAGDAKTMLLALADLADTQGVTLTSNADLRKVVLSSRIDAVTKAIQVAEQAGELLIISGRGQERFYIVTTGMTNDELLKAIREVQMWKIHSGIICPTFETGAA